MIQNELFLVTVVEVRYSKAAVKMISRRNPPIDTALLLVITLIKDNSSSPSPILKPNPRIDTSFRIRRAENKIPNSMTPARRTITPIARVLVKTEDNVFLPFTSTPLISVVYKGKNRKKEKVENVIETSGANHDRIR
jgi:hypothetical protein